MSYNVGNLFWADVVRLDLPVIPTLTRSGMREFSIGMFLCKVRLSHLLVSTTPPG